MPKFPLLFTAFFCGIFLYLYTFPISDGDCFWHLATGRWIAEHKTLPTSDFLSFTVSDHNPFRPESQRIPFLLKQYWLGQLALFGTWQLGGSAGIVLLRAVTYTGILALLFFWMYRYNRGVLPLVLTMLVGLLLREIPNERPQLFSFFFTPLLLLLLETGNNSGLPRRLALLGMPLLMLVWSNTHGAYLLGTGLIGLAIVPILIKSMIRKRKIDRPYTISALCAIVITVVNPAGFLAWKEFFQADSTYIASVYENLSPWFVAVKMHDWHPAYWIYICICLAGVLWRWRSMEPGHLLTLAGLCFLSLTALRYLAFPLLAAPLLVRYLPDIPWRRRTVLPLLITFTLWIGCTWNHHLLEFKPRGEFPQAAVEFIRQQVPAPQLFNAYDWGGYISWFVPGVKTFIDGRGLVEEISLLQDRTLHGEAWRESLDRYGINTVIIPGMSEISGTVYPLAELLATAIDWRLVFADDVALVFVRTIAANERIIARHTLQGNSLQTHLVQLAGRLITENPVREEYWQTKANALQLLGDRAGAVAAYRRVVQINPDNEWAKRMLALGGG